MSLNPYDQFLEENGLTYEDLTPEEREMYRKAAIDVSSVSLDSFAEHLQSSMYSLLMEHCDTPDTPDNQDVNNKTKARLKNYLFMLLYLAKPKEAAKAIERSLKSRKVTKVS